LDKQGSICSRDSFSLHHHIHTSSGAHPAFYPMGTRDPSLDVKQPGQGADSSPPSSARVKTALTYTSAPPYVFMAWCLVKQSDNYTFTFTFTFTVQTCVSGWISASLVHNVLTAGSVSVTYLGQFSMQLIRNQISSLTWKVVFIAPEHTIFSLMFS